jgi:hypothetical protein
MWSCEHGARIRALARVCVILSTAGLLACGFEPLYGRHPSSGEESIRDKLGEVLIAPIPERQGTPQARVAVALRNALQFDLNGAAGAVAPTHRLEVVVRNNRVNRPGYRPAHGGNRRSEGSLSVG